MAPTTVPATTPNTKPQATRQSVASACVCNSPDCASSEKVLKITEGGGTRRPLDQPRFTAISQPAASTTGNSKPSAGRAKYASRRFDVCCSRAACSSVAVIRTKDTATPSIATDSVAHVPIVDQVIQDFLDVDIRLHHTGLLQRDTGLEDRL